ncbi:protein FAM217B isoform X2 [Catharus ustulatus]|uniref:protein FAM217B isoform X2 n=1 Tax=Catharus ustulatus TaxID=91951 RepID=UPI001408CE83|nr:protein FAM217B isoform X2 [Catharus ustulatus]
MGPGIQEYPLLLHRETQQKESHSHTYESHKGMVNNGKSHPSTKGLNKPISYVKSPPGRLGKNVSSAIEKISHDTQDGHQPSGFKKGRNQLDGNNQSKRIPSVCSSLHSAQGPKRSPSERRQNESFLHRSPPERRQNESFMHRSSPERRQNESFMHRSPPERRQNESFLHSIPSGTKGSTQENFCRVKDVPVQHFYCSKKEQMGKNHEEYIAEASPGSSKWQEASVGEMFLDFESVQIIKEDAEDDSASDLSDSERIPIPPSPCTPPELILRAEEIDPVCLEHIPEMGFKESEYYYPDFLPPPFNSWDLKQLAILVHVEGKSDFHPKPTGSLEKYIERLVQLEWLQMQTVQSEKGRATKGRPQTAPGPSRALKSPGKGKALLSPVPSRQAVPQESVSRLPRSCVGHRAELCSEDTRQVRSHPGHPKLPERMACAASSQRQTGDGRSELRKKPAAKQQLLSLQPPESSSKIQSVGNIRPPKQSPAPHGAAAPIKGLKPYMCTNPKKNGNASNYVPPKKPTVDRKIKPNGTKQTPRKFQ